MAKRALSTSLDEAELSESKLEQDQWTVVRSKAAKRKDTRSSPAAMAPREGRHPRAPPSKNFHKFKTLASDPTASYQIVRTIEKSCPGIKILAKPNLQGVWVISPLSQQAYDWLASTKIVALK